MAEEDYQSDGLTQEDFEEQLDDVSLDMDVDDDGANDMDLEGDDGVPDNSTVASSVDGNALNRNDATSQFLEASKVSASAKKGRERSNAKPVECLDLDGNLIKVYNSGTLAARELNVQQGDISLCCRGLKDSVGGYRFRFSGAQHIIHPDGMKLKRGFAFVTVEDQPKSEFTQRTTRASRGEYGLGQRADERTGKNILAPPSIKARTWHTESYKAGPFTVEKWVPNVENPTEELQAMKPKTDKKKRLSTRKSIAFA